MAYGNDSQTVLLIHSHNVDGATAFVDSSLAGNGGNRHAISKTGLVIHSILDTTGNLGASSIYLPNSTNNYLSIPAHTDFFFDSNFTIDFWFKSLDTTQSQSGIVAWYSSSSSQFSLEIYSGFLRFKGVTPSGNILDLSTFQTNISGNVWYHAALVRESTLMRLYLDGVLKQTSNIINNPINYGVPLLIGKKIGTATFYGYVTELRISRVARNDFPTTFPYTSATHNVSNINANTSVFTPVSVSSANGTNTNTGIFVPGAMNNIMVINDSIGLINQSNVDGHNLTVDVANNGAYNSTPVNAEINGNVGSIGIFGSLLDSSLNGEQDAIGGYETIEISSSIFQGDATDTLGQFNFVAVEGNLNGGQDAIGGYETIEISSSIFQGDATSISSVQITEVGLMGCNPNVDNIGQFAIISVSQALSGLNTSTAILFPLEPQSSVVGWNDNAAQFTPTQDLFTLQGVVNQDGLLTHQNVDLNEFFGNVSSSTGFEDWTNISSNLTGHNDTLVLLNEQNVNASEATGNLVSSGIATTAGVTHQTNGVQQQFAIATTPASIQYSLFQTELGIGHYNAQASVQARVSAVAQTVAVATESNVITTELFLNGENTTEPTVSYTNIEPTTIAIIQYDDGMATHVDVPPQTIGGFLTEIEAIVGQCHNHHDRCLKLVSGCDLKRYFNLADEVPDSFLNIQIHHACLQLYKDTGIPEKTYPIERLYEWHEAQRHLAFAYALPHLHTFTMQGAARAQGLATQLNAVFLSSMEVDARVAELKKRYRELVTILRWPTPEVVSPHNNPFQWIAI